MKVSKKMTKKEMPPRDGFTAGLHLISLFSCFVLTPKFCENFKRIELMRIEKIKVTPITRTINNNMFSWK
jgi:hypothetical protein